MSIRTWRRRALVLTLIAVGGLLLVASDVFWWGGSVRRALVPMARPGWAALTPEVKASTEAQFRLAIIQASAAVGAVFVLNLTARTYRLTRRGQETDRFVKALERLGSNERYVRIGGVLAMDQIVEDAPGQATHAAQVLNAFIRDRAPRQPESEPITRQRVTAARRAALHHATSRVEPKLALPQEPDADVQRALTMLTRPSMRSHVAPTEVIDLVSLHLAGAQLNWASLTRAQLDGANLTRARIVGANLTSARLNGANLTGAQLDGANLTSAWLDGAILTGAFLGAANLTGAQLDGANLTGAQLDGAILTGARLNGANLTSARLNGADLRSADQLTISQVVSAWPTKTTQLPPDIAADPRVTARIEELEVADWQAL
ncbi:pentapeptide repeat-containing protein [Streptomyces sp. ASQP_92]|uniref:pentapeptide repeat-containing protein n=1 Tax=Streptomyces sp. ASQP_92 TaxID=2979116 RepID=UPI0021BE4302|nr:pentapeptide repeat-containing protein [Streptomyces sp. ASQP_92]MCT9092344.1 pentapeptide repeat-containing protein [Streptomyces sp. ASQP_92]